MTIVRTLERVFKRRGGAAAPAVTTLFYDTFTDANGTEVSAHTADINLGAQPWVDLVANPQITSNKAVNTSSRASVDVSYADVTLTGLSTTQAAGVSGGCGIVFRATDAANLWYADFVYNPPSSVVRIIERTTNSDTERASSAFDVQLNTEYPIQVVLSGSAINATLNGIPLAYSSAVRATVTKHGFSIGSAGGKFDDMRMTTP